jgi:hypothetical protein
MAVRNYSIAFGLSLMRTIGARDVKWRQVINMKSTIIWDITPCSSLKVNLLSRWYLDRFFSALKMEAIFSTDTSVDFQRTARRLVLYSS